MIPIELEQLHRTHWNSFAGNYNLTTDEGSGKYTEHWVTFAKMNGYPKVENLKKNAGQTQYNGHATDAFLYAVPYDEFNPLMQAVDIIGGSGGPNPTINWGIDIPRYTSADIWIGTPVNPNTVPWVAYNENGFQSLKDVLAFDYSRRPQNADFDVSVWSARVFHSSYMGPSGIPLGMDAAIKKHRIEWCQALGVPVVPFPPHFL